MRLCAHVHKRVACLCYAAEGSEFCAAHRDEGVVYRATRPRKATDVVKVCVLCHQPIHPGQIVRKTRDGLTHAQGCPLPGILESEL
jgi:hypothetical protein